MRYPTTLLLKKGYFPAELPPPFETEALGRAFPDIRDGISNAIKSKPQEVRVTPVVYHLARQGSLRRRLILPHPLYQVELCRLVEENSSLIEAAISRSPWSASRPVVNSERYGRALERKIREEGIVEERARVRASGRFLVSTDIAGFYASVYTHSIGWALAGKAYSKVFGHLSKTHQGYAPAKAANLIDKAIRDAQDRQSVGIPVGPDTSLLLAEALLAQVDKALDTVLPPGATATRYMDDYQISVHSLADAERILAQLQSLLRNELELELNPRKTRILELPAPLEAPWVTSLKGIFRDGTHHSRRQQRRDLLRLHDLATSARTEYPEEHVFAYAIGVLRHIKLEQSNWALAQHLFLQAMRAEPGLLPTLLHELLWYRHHGMPIDDTRLQDVLTEVIHRHAPQDHSSEVAWAIWGHIEFQMKADDSVVRDLESTTDPVVGLLALYAASLGLFPSIAESLSARVNAPDFWGNQWILVYEATRRQWLPGHQELRKVPGYRLLDDAKVSFFNVDSRLDPGAHPKSRIY